MKFVVETAWKDEDDEGAAALFGLFRPPAEMGVDDVPLKALAALVRTAVGGRAPDITENGFNLLTAATAGVLEAVVVVRMVPTPLADVDTRMVVEGSMPVIAVFPATVVVRCGFNRLCGCFARTTLLIVRCC